MFILEYYYYYYYYYYHHYYYYYYYYCFLQQREIKRSISGQKRNLNQERAKALYDILSPEYMRIVELASEKGASSWLTVLPIDSSGFALHKSAFRDALCLRYGWPCKDLPSQCKCGNQPSVDHLLSCPMGGYPSLRHNEIRDITASFLSEVCRNVSIEPGLILPLMQDSM